MTRSLTKSEAAPITLHRGGFPPISPETIGKALRDGRAHRRFTGKPVHYRIEADPPVSKLEWAFICIVFAAMCFMIVSL